MCLYPTHKKEKIAKEDIKCYKVFESDERKLFSIFVHQLYTHKESKEPELECELNDWGNTIVKTGIHSHKNKSRSQGFYGWVMRCDMKIILIVECIIPKGSKYFKGISAYASDTLIITDNIIAADDMEIAKKVISNLKEGCVTL